MAAATRAGAEGFIAISVVGGAAGMLAHAACRLLYDPPGDPLEEARTMHHAIRALICAAAMLIPVLASAQGYPSKPVRLIVPFPAGGPADLFGRALAQSMSASLGQPVIIENRSGVGGVLGVDNVAKAPPDGYLLALNSGSAVAIAPFSMEKMPYDPKKDLALITTVVKVPEVLVVHPSLPVNSLAELIAYAKANPGKVNFGSAGGGTITHLAGELLKVEAGINIVHVPYKGAAPAVQDLLGGQVQMGVFDVPVLLPHIRSGKLKALALTSGSRSPALPDVPTTAELGLPKVNSDNWYGLVAPAGTPADVLTKLHASATGALRSPEVIEQYGKVSGIAFPSSPAEYAAFIDSEQAKWGPVVKAIGFKQQ
jgi:tripartite-type tricarboxylate transporter receptor subunit TctC